MTCRDRDAGSKTAGTRFLLPPRRGFISASHDQRKNAGEENRLTLEQLKQLVLDTIWLGSLVAIIWMVLRIVGL